MDTIKIASEIRQEVLNQYQEGHFGCLTMKCEKIEISCKYCPFGLGTPGNWHDIRSIHPIYNWEDNECPA